ncbi:MAG: hypothetical protein ACI92S_002819, partial [Planctomycetaceae bacterium]
FWKSAWTAAGAGQITWIAWYFAAQIPRMPPSVPRFCSGDRRRKCATVAGNVRSSKEMGDRRRKWVIDTGLESENQKLWPAELPRSSD